MLMSRLRPVGDDAPDCTDPGEYRDQDAGSAARDDVRGAEEAAGNIAAEGGFEIGDVDIFETCGKEYVQGGMADAWQTLD